VPGTLDRVRDLGAVLDELACWSTNNPVLAGRLDLANVGVIGGSWGGVTVAEFARIDDRCKAIIALDPGGPTPLELLQFGVRKPLMQINRAGNTDKTVWNLNTTDAVWFQISGTDHAFVAKNDWYWLDHPTNLPLGMESERTIIGYSLWMFDNYLKHLPVPPLPLPGYPLVTNIIWK